MNPPAQTGCIPLAEMAAHLRGQSTQDRQLAITQHLAQGCLECAANERWLAKALRLAAADHSFALPPATIANVVTYFKEQTGQPTLGQWLAQLVFDSFDSMQLAPARHLSGGNMNSRQMLYQANGYEIDLRFEAAEDNSGEELLGQVMAEKAVGGLNVQLWRDEALVAETTTDEGGYFNITTLSSGAYDLRLQLGDGEIQINHVTTALA